MRRDSSILPRSSRFRKMSSAGGHVPAHTVAPASASALAMAKPYPPSSATPATRARLPRRSILSIRCPYLEMRDARCGMRGTRHRRIPHPASRIPSYEEPRGYGYELWMSYQRVSEDPSQRPFLERDRVHGAGERIEERVVHIFQGALDAVIAEMVVAQELHPRGVIRAQSPGAGVAGADRRRGGPTGEAARLHGIHDPAAGKWVDHVRRVARQHDAVRVRRLDGRMHDDAAHRVRRPGAPGVATGDPLIEVLPGIAAVGFECHQAEPDIRDAGPFGEQPRVPARRDLLPELQVDRVRVEVDALKNVLSARLHVARRHAGIEPGPAADHRL